MINQDKKSMMIESNSTKTDKINNNNTEINKKKNNDTEQNRETTLLATEMNGLSHSLALAEKEHPMKRNHKGIKKKGGKDYQGKKSHHKEEIKTKERMKLERSLMTKEIKDLLHGHGANYQPLEAAAMRKDKGLMKEQM